MAPVPVIPTPPGEPSKKKKKKAGKVKSAWIAFVGRILAQVIGAAASVIFGIVILQKYQSSGRESTRAAAPAAQPQAAAVRARRSPGETALAVLPLANFSGDAKQEYFADGLTDALTANLAQMRNVRVISRTSAMAYKGLQKPLTEIARELNVDLLVEGSVVRDGERVRVTAQLIDGATDEHLWARSFDRTIKNVLALQDDIAHAIAAEVGEAARPPAPALVDPVVYDLYLRGRFAWNARTPAGFDEAEKFFKQAIAKDPNFALGYAGLADVYQLAGQTGTAASTQQARAAARRALEIDESVAEAHTSLAGLLHRTDADVKGAEREFRRAIALNANYATAHQWFAILLAEEGRDQEAMAHAQRAIALDPLAAPMYQTLALVHYYGRRFDDAMAASRRAIESAPQLPLARDLLARAAIAKGTPETPGDTARPDTVLAQLNTQRPRPLAALALWHAAAGHRDRAFEALGDLVARSPAAVQPLKNDPLFDPLRSDPRFAELVQRAAARLESKS